MQELEMEYLKNLNHSGYSKLFLCQFKHHKHSPTQASSPIFLVIIIYLNAQMCFAVNMLFVCCLFSRRYNQLWLYFPQPGSGL